VSLGCALSAGTLSRSEALALLAKVAAAVHHAHGRGLIHRDLKPMNILVGERGEPFVLDFGLSWCADDRQAGDVQQIVGTPAYMSPEQVRGVEAGLTPATDIYSLGAILYEVLTGRPPFAGATAWKTRQSAMGERPMAPRQIDASIDAGCERVVLWCLDKNPGRRYASAAQLAEDLRRVAARKTPHGPGTKRLWRRFFG
jgi:serine/threonine-protein kinase